MIGIALKGTACVRDCATASHLSQGHPTVQGLQVFQSRFFKLNCFPSNAHYRVDVKRRLNAPFQKEQVCFYFRTNWFCEASIELNSLWVRSFLQSQLVKLQKALKPEEFAAAMVNVTNRYNYKLSPFLSKFSLLLWPTSLKAGFKAQPQSCPVQIRTPVKPT